MGGKYQRLASETGSKTLKKGIFSYLFFTWLNGLLKLGYQRPLVDDDVLELSDENKAQGLVAKLHVKCHGQVFIDGVDLGTIDIQVVRRSMAVITQDPVLFAGSLRKNLDPFNRFTDQAIWTALDEVQLMKKVTKLHHQLDYCVGEGGSGFSVGERQLLCLARALLQNCKILVLDEATANVDYKTDHLIQQVIRQKFTKCTVLTIAHRVNTIMDYDKVVVLDHGHVMEYDNPRVLDGKENGFFSRLIKGHRYKS